MSAFSNQGLRSFWSWHSYSALPTSNFYSWNLSSWGKTTQQQSYVNCKYRELTLPGSNWGAADTAQNNNPISPKTSYFVVLCLLSVQMNCSICLPNRERCDTSNKFKQSSCSDTKKSNQSFFAVLRHRLQLCTSWNNSRISQPITVFESALLFPICI